MKFLLGLLLLGSTAFGQSSANRIVEGAYFPNASVEKNYIKNSTCDKNYNDVRLVSGGTLDITSSAPIKGAASCVFDASGANDILEWSAHTIEKEITSGKCEARLRYNGNATSYVAYVSQGSLGVTDQLTLQNVSSASSAIAAFPVDCSDAAPTILVRSTADGAAIQLDEVYYGKLTSVFDVRQISNAVLMGPPTGASAAPTFRAITQNDLPLISAVSGITGIVSMPNGGTGFSGPMTIGDVLVAKGTNNISGVAAGASGTVLTSNGAGVAPSFQNVAASTLAPSIASVSANSTPGVVGAIHANGGGGSFTVRYPGAASVSTGSLLFIKKTDTSMSVISGAEGLSKHLYTPGESYLLQSNGTAWTVLQHQTEYTWQPEVISTRGVTSGPTKGTTSTDRVIGTRTGKNLCLRYAYFSTGTGNNGSGTYNLLLPTYISTPNQIDSTAITLYTGTTVANAFGSATDASSACYLNNTATVEDRGRLYPVTVDMLRLVSNVYNSFWGSGSAGFGGQVYMTCNICLPMSGWED